MLRDASGGVGTVLLVAQRWRQKAEMRRALRRFGRSGIPSAVGLMLAGIVVVLLACSILPWQQQVASDERGSAVTARVVDVIAEQDWAALQVDLPGGTRAVVPVGFGQEYGDRVAVYRSGGSGDWVLGEPVDESGFARWLAMLVAVIGLGASLAGCWWLLEDYAIAVIGRHRRV